MTTDQRMADVIALVKEENWMDAASYGDGICAQLVLNNDDRIWKQAGGLVNENTNRWNATSLGNCAMLIVGGAYFPERQEAIDQIKTGLKILFP